MDKHYSANEIIEMTQENWSQIYSPTYDYVIFLNRIRELGMTRARGIFSGFNISTGEVDILASLRRAPPPHVLSPGELQRSVLITSGGLTKLLYQLEAGGLVSRSVQKKDRRSKLVHLTAKGRKLIERVVMHLMQVDTEWLEGSLTKPELEQLNRLLGKLAESIEKQVGS